MGKKKDGRKAILIDGGLHKDFKHFCKSSEPSLNMASAVETSIKSTPAFVAWKQDREQSKLK